MEIVEGTRAFAAKLSNRLGLRKPSRIVPAALALGVLTGWGLYWLAGESHAAEIARAVWQWLIPGWGTAGRRALAVVGGMLVAVLIVSRMRRKPDLWRIGNRLRYWPLLPTVTAAILVGLGLVWAGYALIDNTLHPTGGDPPTRIDVLKTALTAVAGVGGAVALVVAYRRQRDLEQGRFIERFVAAADQLGSPDPAVRIAGVYAISSAADEASTFTNRQQCIDVLCGYLRLPYDPEHGQNHMIEVVTTEKSAATRTGRESSYRKVFRQNDGEVRRTIVRVLIAHLEQAAPISWSEHNFDFRSAVFDDFNLRDAIFSGDNVNFMGAKFLGVCTFFIDVTFDSLMANFCDVEFRSDVTMFKNCVISGTTRFVDTKFESEITQFEDVTFQGILVDFDNAEFNSEVNAFKDVNFGSYQVDFPGVTFAGAATEFDGVRFGVTNFTDTNFSADVVRFKKCEFADERATFARSTIARMVFEKETPKGEPVTFTIFGAGRSDASP